MALFRLNVKFFLLKFGIKELLWFKSSERSNYFIILCFNSPCKKCALEGLDKKN